MVDPRFSSGLRYFESKGWEPFPFQLQVWKDFLDGKSGVLNAPTGSGKLLHFGSLPSWNL